MLRVGLTGGSAPASRRSPAGWRELGRGRRRRRQLARRAVEPGSEGLAAVVDAFGPQVLAPDGALDRPALGRLVFADEAARGRLNGVLHPRIAELTAREVATAPADAVVVHDVPLLVENGLGANYQLVVVVTAPRDERVRRLVADRGMAPGDALARIAAQAGDDARRAAADVLLDNGGEPRAVLAAVDGCGTSGWCRSRRTSGSAAAPRRRPAAAAAADRAELGATAGRAAAACRRRARGRRGSERGCGDGGRHAPPSAMGDVRRGPRSGRAAYPAPGGGLCWPDPALPVLVDLRGDREE